MTYKKFSEINPEIIDSKLGYTDYLVSKFKNVSNYLSQEFPNSEDKYYFEGKNSDLLEDMAVFMEELIRNIENE